MEIASKTALAVEDAGPGLIQGRAQAQKGGDRASAGKRPPEALGPFSGSVIRVGVARVPSQRLNPRK